MIALLLLASVFSGVLISWYCSDASETHEIHEIAHTMGVDIDTP